jgi:catechol 2,3-dioxygenase-like lactoylglutathione lyase family enzyme
MDHISIPVRDAARTRDFYAPALAELGWRQGGFTVGAYVAFKKSGSTALYFLQSDQVCPTHLAFVARSRDEVVAFHTAALEAGGADNGCPGPRPHYGKEYYAAFVLDPDGHNIEAVLGGVATKPLPAPEVDHA